jgi:hypothetical protein
MKEQFDWQIWYLFVSYTSYSYKFYGEIRGGIFAKFSASFILCFFLVLIYFIVTDKFLISELV